MSNTTSLHRLSVSIADSTASFERKRQSLFGGSKRASTIDTAVGDRPGLVNSRSTPALPTHWKSTLFPRKKSHEPEISQPFDFRHVSHTERDDLIHALPFRSQPTSPKLIQRPAFPVTRPRAASREELVNLIGEARTPPTMIHPAFRDQPTTPTESISNSSLLEHTVSNSSLEPVLEEETEEDERVEYAQSSHSSQPTTLMRDSTSSFSTPSLTSDESWKSDVDFCYMVEAESSSNFAWEGSSAATDSRKSSVVVLPREMDAYFADFDSACSSPDQLDDLVRSVSLRDCKPATEREPAATRWTIATTPSKSRELGERLSQRYTRWL